MAKRTKICRVCGAEYPACNSAKTGSAKFNWREVACSPECGLKYLNAVNEARKTNAAQEPQAVVEREPAEIELAATEAHIVVEHDEAANTRKRGQRRHFAIDEDAGMDAKDIKDAINAASDEPAE